MKNWILLISAWFLWSCAGDAGNALPPPQSSCTPNQTYECPCSDGNQGTQSCNATGTGFAASCECSSGGEGEGEGQIPSGGACTPNQSYNCACPGGSVGTQTCNSAGSGYVGPCTCAGAHEGEGEGEGEACVPGETTPCNTLCNTVGSKTCDAKGSWGACVGAAEECNGKDDDCNGMTDEGLAQLCDTECGEGTIECVNGAWGPCSAPSAAVEICDGVDNNCNGATDENLTAPAATKNLGVCTGKTQECKGESGWQDPVWTTIQGYEEYEMSCDGVDNDCDAYVDGNDPNIYGKCPCTLGQAPQSCGSVVGECSPGTKACVALPNGGSAWSDCAGANYNEETQEVCDGLDNDCNGFTDDSIPGVGAQCGSANTSQGGSYHLPCSEGTVACHGGQMVCVGGVDPTPEVCDGLDNDCNGFSDDDVQADQYESNNSCSAANDVGKAVENQGPLVINGTLYDPGSSSDDVDWYKVTAAESAGFCLFSSEGPFTVKIRLTNIPEGSDYDLCVWPAADNSCGALPGSMSGVHDEGPKNFCMEQGIFATGATPEEFTFSWEGECLQNDDRTFYVKVVAWSIDPDIDCAPYNLEVTMTGD